MSNLPEYAWRTIVNNVAISAPRIYTLDIKNTNPNDPGANGDIVNIGFYIIDYVGHYYSITEINVGGVSGKIKVYDDFNVGVGPQQGRKAYIYKSVGEGYAPYLAPIRFEELDLSAQGYALPIEKDIIWSHRGLHGVGTGIDEVNLTKITLGAGLKFSDLLSTGWNGGKSVTIGVDDHNNLPGLQGIGPDLFHLMYEQYRGVSAGSGGYLPRYNVAGWLENSKFTDDGTTPKYNANTVWHAGIANLPTVDWSAKELTVTTAKIGSFSGYLKGTSGVVGAVYSIPESDISFTDITNGDASINKHGYFPKLPTPTGKYLRDDLTWQPVSGGVASGTSTEVQLRNSVTGALDSDPLFKYDKTTGVLVAGTSFRDIPGLSSIFAGFESGLSTATAIRNTAVGYRSLRSNLTGSDSAAFGCEAGFSATRGFHSLHGVKAGYNLTTAQGVVAVGYNSAAGYTTESNVIAIGAAVTKAEKAYGDFILGYASNLLMEGNHASKWFRINAAQLTRSTNATSSAIIVTGTATSVTTTQINDTSKTWTTNAYANKVVVFTSGTNVQQARLIISNTATQLTISGTILTDTTPTYKIIDATVITNDNLSTAYSFDLSSGNSHAVVLPEFTSVFDRSINTRIGIEGFVSGARLYVVTQNSQSFKGQFISTGAQTTYLNADKESIVVMPHILGTVYHWDVFNETPNASYAALTYGSTVEWDCTTGLNKTLSSSGNFTLSLTNLVNGMSGDLVVNVSSISTITITTTGFTQKKYGSLTSKPIGKYHLCWICEGTNIDFNITDTPYA